MGSSMLMMLAARLVFMWSTIAARVVVLPDPVGPVTSTRPRCSSANLVTTGGKPSSEADSALGSTRRKTRPVEPLWRKALQRNRPRPLAEREKSASPVSLYSWSRSAGRITWTRSSHSSWPTAGNGVIRRSPLTRALGGEPTLMCKSDAPCSTTCRRTAGKSIIGDWYRQAPSSA